MTGVLQKQIATKSLPAFSVYKKLRLNETDLNEVARSVVKMLPYYVNGNIGSRVTLSEKNLKVLADIPLMYEAMINLVKYTIDAMSDGGKFSLKTNRVNFENQPIIAFNGLNYGQCASISLAATDVRIDEKAKERAYEFFSTIKMFDDKEPGLPIARHIISRHGGTIKAESTPKRGVMINVYLPLVRSGIANMTPIPLPGICQ